MKKVKNTRLFYNDEETVEAWKALEPSDCKELFLKCLTYKYGDKVKIEEFSKPLLYSLFISSFKPKIDYNEEKWLNDGRKETSKENGKKGGRPKSDTKTTADDW